MSAKRSDAGPLGPTMMPLRGSDGPSARRLVDRPARPSCRYAASRGNSLSALPRSMARRLIVGYAVRMRANSTLASFGA
jgi:hypothetical protein